MSASCAIIIPVRTSTSAFPWKAEAPIGLHDFNY
jgi:hypothetical protein